MLHPMMRATLTGLYGRAYVDRLDCPGLDVHSAGGILRHAFALPRADADLAALADRADRAVADDVTAPDDVTTSGARAELIRDYDPAEQARFDAECARDDAGEYE